MKLGAVLFAGAALALSASAASAQSVEAGEAVFKNVWLAMPLAKALLSRLARR